MGVFVFTQMPRSPRRDRKTEALREQAVLNPRPERVRDKLFVEHDFFDARDLVQVKYEMVRRVQADGASVSEAAAAFGFSRPSFYQAQDLLRVHGLAGLLPKKRGPRSAHKLSAEVVEYVAQVRAQEPGTTSHELAERIEHRFGIQVHPRSVERALARGEKKSL
jgi:transposase